MSDASKKSANWFSWILRVFIGAISGAVIGWIGVFGFFRRYFDISPESSALWIIPIAVATYYVVASIRSPVTAF